MSIFLKRKNKQITRKITAFALTYLIAFNPLAFAVKDRQELPEKPTRAAGAASTSSASTSASPISVVYTEVDPSFGGVSIPWDIVRNKFFRLENLGEQDFSEGVRTVDVGSFEFNEALNFSHLSPQYRRSFFRYLNESGLILVINANSPRPRAIDRVIEQAIHLADWGAHVRVYMEDNSTKDVLRLIRHRPRERKARLEEMQGDGSIILREWVFRGSLGVNFDLKRDKGLQAFPELAPLLADVEEEHEGGYNTGIASLELTGTKFEEKEARSLGNILRSGTLSLLTVRYVPLGVAGARYIADGLRENRVLRRLYVDGCRLSNEGATALVQAVAPHPALEEFSLSDRSSFIGGEDPRDALRDLLRQSSTLQVLDLAGNGNGIGGEGVFGDAEVVSIVQGVLLNPESALQKLFLNGNNIGAEGARAIRDLLLGNRSIRKLFLTGNDLRETGAAALAEGLRGNVTLEELDVSSTKIGPRGVYAIVETLANQQGLRRLSIGSNEVQPLRVLRRSQDSEVLETLGEVFETSLKENRSLKELDLKFNHLGDTVLLRLAKSLQTNRTLRQLKLAGNEITDENLVALSCALADRDAVIEVLDLGYNDITLVGINGLAEGIRTNRSLVELLLDRNNIGDEGSIALARAFEGQHRRIKKLQLRNNNIGDRGAIALAYLSTRNPQLRELYLDENNIGVPGGQAMGYALSGDAAGLLGLLQDYNALGIDGGRVTKLPLSRLQRLELSKNNDIGEGNEIIARGMGVNMSLRVLDLYSTGVSEAHILGFAEALNRNRTLLNLNLGGNGLGNKSALILGRALKRNKVLQVLSLYTNSVPERTKTALTEQHSGRIHF